MSVDEHGWVNPAEVSLEDCIIDKRFLAIQPQQRATYERHRAEWRELADRMVAAGELLVMPLWWDDQVPILAKLGIAFTIGDALPVELRLGERSRCHQNVSRLYLESDEGMEIASGYALGPGDNKWRQHSWAVDFADAHVIETTSVRDAYFGFVLPDSVAEKWARAQLAYE